jgi:hypothetical protein
MIEGKRLTYQRMGGSQLHLNRRRESFCGSVRNADSTPNRLRPTLRSNVGPAKPRTSLFGHPESENLRPMPGLERIAEVTLGPISRRHMGATGGGSTTSRVGRYTSERRLIRNAGMTHETFWFRGATDRGIPHETQGHGGSESECCALPIRYRGHSLDLLLIGSVGSDPGASLSRTSRSNDLAGFPTGGAIPRRPFPGLCHLGLQSWKNTVSLWIEAA